MVSLEEQVEKESGLLREVAGGGGRRGEGGGEREEGRGRRGIGLGGRGKENWRLIESLSHPSTPQVYKNFPVHGDKHGHHLTHLPQ